MPIDLALPVHVVHQLLCRILPKWLLLRSFNVTLQTNSKLQTSNPDVYAVGDVAAFPLTKYGITTRQEHVANARSSATTAVSHILSPSDTPDYYYLPFFYSRVFNLSWQVCTTTLIFLPYQKAS